MGGCRALLSHLKTHGSETFIQKHLFRVAEETQLIDKASVSHFVDFKIDSKLRRAQKFSEVLIHFSLVQVPAKFFPV